jgi:hypothetical protein
MLMISFCITVSLASAQEKPAPEYQLKAVFLYNFTHFIDWPSTAFESGNDPFVIGIVGNDPFGSFLEEAVAGETVNNHPIVIRKFTDINAVNQCHMLFINIKDPANTREILNSVRNTSTLTVGDGENFATIGGIIGFFTENNKIRMHINTVAAKNAKLTISSKLLGVARLL